MATNAYYPMKDNQSAGDLNAVLDFPDAWFPHRFGVACGSGVAAPTIATVMAYNYFPNVGGSVTALATGAALDGSRQIPIPAKNKLYPVEGAPNIFLRAQGYGTNASAATFIVWVLGCKRASDGSSGVPFGQPFVVFVATLTNSGPSSGAILVNPLTQEAVSSTTFYGVGTITMPDTTSFPTARIFDSGNARIAVANFDPLGADYLWCIPHSGSGVTMSCDIGLARGKG